MQRDEIIKARRRYIGSALSLSYRDPLHLVRGSGQYLYDASGREFLDCVNNVCHVGHCHPRVTEAAYRQMTRLNTNTRYLYEELVGYAEALSCTLPPALSVCYFTCSGSEANDLALRMARTHTGQTDVVVVDGAYHGNTAAMIEISPYKHGGPGGSGTPAHVHPVALPDVYRGAYGKSDAGERYAEELDGIIAQTRRQRRSVAAFFCESVVGCGGQIVLPPRYLKNAYERIRDDGGVCVADEVQVGFGRVGSRFWGFETQDVVPDIVTLGKPMGNGHPLAAVVTTPEIAASFDNGMEYFNSFGGNPVSCAVGLAVLKVLEEEKLQENAARVGLHLRRGLEGLMRHHVFIGDVRGLGLFLGIELVLDRETQAPAEQLAAQVVEEMKDRGVLLSIDGPLNNVIKIKPPMVFNAENADVVVRNLDEVLGQVG